MELEYEYRIMWDNGEWGFWWPVEHGARAGVLRTHHGQFQLRVKPHMCSEKLSFGNLPWPCEKEEGHDMPHVAVPGYSSPNLPSQITWR